MPRSVAVAAPPGAPKRDWKRAASRNNGSSPMPLLRGLGTIFEVAHACEEATRRRPAELHARGPDPRLGRLEVAVLRDLARARRARRETDPHRARKSRGVAPEPPARERGSAV